MVILYPRTRNTNAAPKTQNDSTERSRHLEDSASSAVKSQRARALHHALKNRIVTTLFDSMFYLAKLALASWTLAALIVASMGIVARPEKSDLAVVLGNTVHVDGVPSKRLTARLDRALRCYEQAQCGTIFVSGGINNQGTDEAIAMRDYLLRRGVPPGRIVVDSLGADTWATAKNAIDYMKSHNMSSVMVTTQYFHIPRATIAFKRNGIERVSGAYTQFFEARDIYSSFREVPAIVWYCVRTDVEEDK